MRLTTAAAPRATCPAVTGIRLPRPAEHPRFIAPASRRSNRLLRVSHLRETPTRRRQTPANADASVTDRETSPRRSATPRRPGMCATDASTKGDPRPCPGPRHRLNITGEPTGPGHCAGVSDDHPTATPVEPTHREAAAPLAVALVRRAIRLAGDTARATRAAIAARDQAKAAIAELPPGPGRDLLALTCDVLNALAGATTPAPSPRRSTRYATPSPQPHSPCSWCTRPIAPCPA
jgi:hypothetical protein